MADCMVVGTIAVNSAVCMVSGAVLVTVSDSSVVPKVYFVVVGCKVVCNIVSWCAVVSNVVVNIVGSVVISVIS